MCGGEEEGGGSGIGRGWGIGGGVQGDLWGEQLETKVGFRLWEEKQWAARGCEGQEPSSGAGRR